MSTADFPPHARAGGAGRTIAVVAGALLALIAAALVLAGLAVLVAHAALRDSDGYFNSSTETLRTPTRAITAERVQLGDTHGGDWAVEHLDARVRVRAGLAGGTPVFVGIARQRDLDRYLNGVAHDRLTDWNDGPQYTRSPGARAVAPPATQRFWIASATGSGNQEITWKPSGGSWGAVVMRADGGRGLLTDVRVGVKLPWLLWAGLGLLALGALVGAAAGGLLWTGLRTPHGPAPVAPAGPGAPPPAMPAGPGSGAPPPTVAAGAATAAVGADGGSHADAAAAGKPASAYPVDVRAQLDAPLSPWLWLVKWILAIPHWIVLAFLWIAFLVLTVVAFFAVVFTGRYPRGIFDFNVGVVRWSWRAEFYATHAIATDRYPPFSLQPDQSYPADVEIPYPARLSRGKALVKWWLLAIPHYAVLAVFLGGGWWWSSNATGFPGLLLILVLVAGVVLLFTGRYPKDVFRLVVGINRWVVRVIAYAALMRDEYPPFRLDP
jgi:hypothetical protein